MAQTRNCHIFDFKNLLTVIKNYWILSLLLIIVCQHTVSAPVPGCKSKAKRMKLKDAVSELKTGKWILVERFKPMKNTLKNFPKRQKRDITPSRPSDVPSTYCPWRWEYDFDKNREPQFLPLAVCNNCNTKKCKTVEMKYNVLVKSCEKVHLRGRNINLWKKSTVTLPVAFYYQRP